LDKRLNKGKNGKKFVGALRLWDGSYPDGEFEMPVKKRESILATDERWEERGEG